MNFCVFSKIYQGISNLKLCSHTIFVLGYYRNMLLTPIFFIYRRLYFLVLVSFLLFSCNSKRSKIDDDIIHEGGELAQIHCTSCHVFTPPTLLDKETWQLNILTRMGRRLGMDHHSILHYPNISPIWQLNEPVMEQEEWEKILNNIY